MSRSSDTKQLVAGDYVSYFGSLIRHHDIYFITNINADGSYELVMDDEAEVIHLHNVRRQSIARTGGHTKRYHHYA